jgi:hypothetical protein
MVQWTYSSTAPYVFTSLLDEDERPASRSNFYPDTKWTGLSVGPDAVAEIKFPE